MLKTILSFLLLFAPVQGSFDKSICNNDDYLQDEVMFRYKSSYVNGQEYAELQTVCPEVYDPVTDYYKPSSCLMNGWTLAIGESAINMRNTYEIATGDIANVGLQKEYSRGIGNSGKYKLDSLVFTKRSGSKEIYSGTSIDLRTIVYIMDFSSCNPLWKAPVIAKDVELALFNSPNNSVKNNLETYYSTCSYGKTSFLPEFTQIVGPVPVPCSGVVPAPYRPNYKPPISKFSRRNETVNDWWDISKFCTASEQQAWERVALNYSVELARATGNIKLDSLLKWRNRLRNLYILPTGLKCGWSGYADVTCTSPSCSAYVKIGSLFNDLHLIMHESMHNYGLEHANRGILEYGDPTDLMGDFNKAGRNTLLCHNAPNLFRIGWASSVGNITISEMTSNLASFVIPVMSRSDKNMLFIDNGAKYYVSYRVRNATIGAFDSALHKSYSEKVQIHGYNGTQSERVFGFKTNILAALSVGSSWTNGVIKITFNSIVSDGALVDLYKL